MLEYTHQPNGLVLNALNLAGGHFMHLNLLLERYNYLEGQLTSIDITYPFHDPACLIWK
jgi:hypothetical protein